MSVLPYVTSPGSIEKALSAIKSAATPPRVNQDFVKTILNIPGGSGNQITSFLKKIGFVNNDGTPSDLYKKIRNPTTSGQAVAQAIKIGYAPLYARNEYMHQLSDEKLKGLIIEETGLGEDSNPVSLTLAAIKALKKLAKWEEATTLNEKEESTEKRTDIDILKTPPLSGGSVGLNLSYTINLNLPATSDISVFNSIFKSLKENLLRDSCNE